MSLNIFQAYIQNGIISSEVQGIDKHHRIRQFQVTSHFHLTFELNDTNKAEVLLDGHTHTSDSINNYIEIFFIPHIILQGMIKICSNSLPRGSTSENQV